MWQLLSPLCVLKDTTRWLELQVAPSVSLVKSALLPLLPDQLALQVNTQWLALPFAWTVLRENSARLALPRIVVLAATALLGLPWDAKHALLVISARLLIKSQYCVLSDIIHHLEQQPVLYVKQAITVLYHNKGWLAVQEPSVPQVQYHH